MQYCLKSYKASRFLEEDSKRTSSASAMTDAVCCKLQGLLFVVGAMDKMDLWQNRAIRSAQYVPYCGSLLNACTNLLPTFPQSL